MKWIPELGSEGNLEMLLSNVRTNLAENVHPFQFGVACTNGIVRLSNTTCWALKQIHSKSCLDRPYPTEVWAIVCARVLDNIVQAFPLETGEILLLSQEGPRSPHYLVCLVM